jgi:alkyldihydroxyacetonephosphate synthase
VQQIVSLCNSYKIPVIPFGGGSSVTGALQAPKGGICLDLSKNMNKILEINEINQSVSLEAGIMGPELEKALNSYKSGYTCGHFPQSFEYSTPGGWIAARGAGTFSTGYGKMEEMVLSLKVVCPSGIIETNDYPADAEGIDMNRIFAGSEGIFGIITEATLKIRKFQPENTAYASFIFKSFSSAVEAMRNTMQAGSGKPHLFRISDPSETEIAFRLKNFNNSIPDRLLRMMGYKPGERVLMFSAIEGNRAYTSLVKKLLKKMARKSGGFYIGSSPVKKWLKQRYSSAYTRDPLMDKGIITDTIESAVNWKNLLNLWEAVVKYLNSRPKTISMIHISHVYENGANLYITFLSPEKKDNEFEDYLNLHKGLVDTIVSNKGSLSHHHGIGRVLSPWMRNQYGNTTVPVLRAIKKELDPNGIMNPGGMLGLE